MQITSVWLMLSKIQHPMLRCGQCTSQLLLIRASPLLETAPTLWRDSKGDGLPLCFVSPGISVFAALLLQSMGTAQPCPLMCRLCSAYTAECEQISSLADVLEGLSSFTEKIVLQYGDLSVIPPMSFTKFSNLHFLSITRFLVLSLSDLTFSTIHVNSLRILDLSDNHLLSCMIEPMAFSGLLFLDELVLTNNSLDLLRRSWFSEMPVLRKLFLGVNRIGYLPPRAFERLAKLDELVVHNNFIEYLSMDTFYGLPLLTKLDLSSNKILFINHEVFQPLQALKFLLLFQNMLTILPILPGSITFLFLHENPWECNCQLVNSMEPLIATIQSPATVICSRPPGLAGRQVVSLNLEGCAPPSSSASSSSSLTSSSSSAAHPSPSNTLNLSLLYGLLGGLLLGMLLCLLCCCCCLKHCRCPHCANQTENKQTFLNKPPGLFLSEKRTSRVEPQILCSFPVVENMPMGVDLGNMVRGIRCGCRSEASRIHNVEQTRSAFQTPLVAQLSINGTGKTAVMERGNEMKCPILDRLCCQMHRESSDRVSEPPGCTGEQCFANRDHGIGGPCVQQTASNWTERTECVCMKCIDTQLDRKASYPEMQLGDIQTPQTLVHIDFPDGSTIKIDREKATAHQTSPKRKESHQSGFHFYATSDMSLWQECSMERRRPKDTTKNAELSWKTDLYSKDYPMTTGQDNKLQKQKRLHGQGPLPSSDETPPSRSCMPSPTEDNHLSYLKEPYFDMLSVAHNPRKRMKSSQQLDDAPRMGGMALGHVTAQSPHQDPVVSLTRNISTLERVWNCPRCGCEESDPYSILQRTFAQQNTIATSSRRQLDVATQWSSTDTVHLKGSHCEQNDDPDSAYEYPSRLASATALGPVFPLTEKTTRHLTLMDRDGRVDITETLESEIVVDHSVNTPTLNSLSEEMLDAEVSLEALTIDVVGQCFAEGEKDALSSSSNVTHLNPCYNVSSGLLFKIDANPSLLKTPISERSCGTVIYARVLGDGYHQEVATFTSSCPVVQKMCQIDFPLLAEEEKPSG